MAPKTHIKKSTITQLDLLDPNGISGIVAAMKALLKKHLKQKAHSLNPVVIIGGSGLTEGVHNEIDVALDAHELIKVRVNAEDRKQRKQMINTICEHHQADLIQAIGHVIAIYRENSDKQPS